MNGKELYEEISSYVNSFSHTNKEVAEAFSKDHRTLQANSIMLCFALIQKAAQMYEDGNYDGRNDYTFKVCKKIADEIL